MLSYRIAKYVSERAVKRPRFDSTISGADLVFSVSGGKFFVEAG